MKRLRDGLTIKMVADSWTWYGYNLNRIGSRKLFTEKIHWQFGALETKFQLKTALEMRRYVLCFLWCSFEKQQVLSVDFVTICCFTKLIWQSTRSCTLGACLEPTTGLLRLTWVLCWEAACLSQENISYSSAGWSYQGTLCYYKLPYSVTTMLP